MRHIGRAQRLTFLERLDACEIGGGQRLAVRELDVDYGLSFEGRSFGPRTESGKSE
jgi:hypothetical protein